MKKWNLKKYANYASNERYTQWMRLTAYLAGTERVIPFVLPLVLAGCATVPPDVVVGKDEVVRVEVPVVIPCIAADQIEPLPPTSMPPRDAGVAELANGAAADLLRYRELARKQAEMLRACAK